MKCTIPFLPSTINEIQESQIRQRPLSSEELFDIRSLIYFANKKANEEGGTAKLGSLTKATEGTSQPLTGRRVMIPVTSKAFFEGILQQPLRSPSSTNAQESGDPSMNEQIIVNTGNGKLKEMTRAEAWEFFEKQHVHYLSHTAENRLTETTDSGSMSTEQSSSQHSNKDKQTFHSIKEEKSLLNSTTKSNNAFSKHESDTTCPILPFMEIREECDSSGSLVRSEIINISKQMTRLDAQLKQAAQAKDVNGQRFGEVLSQILSEGEKDIHTIDMVESDFAVGIKDDEAHVASQSIGSKYQVTEEEYSRICLRLEELERLEEEDTKIKSENVKSTKRLQSKGWSKGFLISSAKSSSEKRASPAVSETSESSSKEIVKKMLPKKEEVKLISSLASNRDAESFPKIAAKVSFSGENQVRQIPRIGQTKVPQRTNSIETDAYVEAVPDVDPFPPVTTIPFEETVFRGIVKERNSSHRIEEGKLISDEKSSEKKVSRFTMQRQQKDSVQYFD